MAVLFVGEFDCFDEGLISGDKAFGHGADHELPGSFEPNWVELRVRSDDAGGHLVEDGIGPPGSVQVRACEPDQQVAQRCRVQYVGIVYHGEMCRVSTRGPDVQPRLLVRQVSAGVPLPRGAGKRGRR